LDQEPYAVRAEIASTRPRRPSIVVGVILAGLLLAVLKPWSFGGSGAPIARSSSVPSAAAAAATVAAPSATPQVDPNGMLCLGGDVEQIVAYERSANDEVRDWIAIEDVPVTGPLDPLLARTTIFSSHVVGLGICGPFAGAGMPVAGRFLSVQLVSTTDGTAAARDLGRPRQLTLDLGGQDDAVLYGSPQEIVVLPFGGEAESPGASAGDLPALRPWSTGNYAIAFAFGADPPGTIRWIGVDLVPGGGEPR
jgi:hypothetical protein